MKKSILLIVMLFLFSGVEAQSMFVGTFNLRNDNKGDVKNGNGWTLRCPVVCNMINFEAPDLWGTQEMLAHQMKDLVAGLDGYAYIGVGRDDGKQGGEFSPIFYKKAKYKVLKKGNFWLSEHPEKPGLLGWDAACPRICSWGYFKDIKTNFCFYYFNLHMDHIGVVARRESAKLIIAKIKEICKGAPVILTGDFNVDQTNEIYAIFTNSGVLKDSYVYSKHRFAENGTFNNFDSEMKTDSRIDHVFVSPAFSVNYYGVLTNGYWTPIDSASAVKGNAAPTEISLKKYQRRTLSDHYPVFVKMVYNKIEKK